MTGEVDDKGELIFDVEVIAQQPVKTGWNDGLTRDEISVLTKVLRRMGFRRMVIEVAKIADKIEKRRLR